MLKLKQIKTGLNIVEVKTSFSIFMLIYSNNVPKLLFISKPELQLFKIQNIPTKFTKFIL